jgi:tetrahydromethanopterin S-methyltransferase subunit G
MADDETTPEQDDPEKFGLVYLRRIAARLDSIERKLDKVVSCVARIEGRVDLQRELAKLAAELEP